MTAAVLALEGIAKSFGTAPVLRDVSFEVRAGEVHALLGENGAGKSTLMKIVLGLVEPDRGVMTLAGKPYRPTHARAARAAGVVMVPQERTLCGALTVEENIVLGIEPANAAGIVKGAEATTLSERALILVTGESGRILTTRRVSTLSVAEQQLVEIARALVQGNVAGDTAGAGARVLVLDEPTSSLGHEDAARLFDRIRALKDTGMAIVLVTHFLADVRAHADRYTVLRDGRVQACGDPRTTAAEKIVAEMVGRELSGALEGGAANSPNAVDERSVLLEVTDAACDLKPERATFSLRRGEVLGIAGVVGSGRTELLRAIVGLDRLRRGNVRVLGPRGIGLLSEDRGGEGLMLDRSIADNVALTPRGDFFVSPDTETSDAASRIRDLSIRATGPQQRTRDLSGGNQQKVQIARLLREDYDVMLFDEPTRGIDVGSKAQVLSLVRDLAARGKGVVVVSSQFEELLAVCDRIAVLRRGVLGDFRPVADWSEQSLLLEAAS